MAPHPRSVLVYIGSTPDDALGENMIKLPFLWAIHEAFPDARITWIPGFGPAQFDGIRKSLTQGLIHEIVTDLYLGTGPMALFARRRPLAGRGFDLIIDTQKMPVRTLLLRRVPHQRFISSAWGYLFSDAKPPADVPTPRLLIDQLLALVAAALLPSTVAFGFFVIHMMGFQRDFGIMMGLVFVVGKLLDDSIVVVAVIRRLE